MGYGVIQYSFYKKGISASLPLFVKSRSESTSTKKASGATAGVVACSLALTMLSIGGFGGQLEHMATWETGYSLAS